MGAVGSVTTVPSVFSEEATRSLGATYMARSDKARAELGWKTRPLQTGLLETFKWIVETEPVSLPSHTREKQVAALALGTAVTLMVVWLSRRERKS
jgi:hypothetical protein